LSKGRVAEFTVYARKEGRITIPREVRAALDIDEGNLVKCKIEKL
jgi:bifunctional DNA-binding transcriptional regulator/antitoxin component of YhaV-PrlF toxin-antitoxin module